MPMTAPPRVYCLAEDRAGAEIGVRLAVLSLERWAPANPVYIFRPEPTDDFRQWLKQFPRVTLVTERLPGAWDWNCKPHAMLWLMDRGFDDVVWLDSDLVLANDPSPLFEGLTPETLIMVEEPASSTMHGSDLRTRGLGLPLGRTFPITLNSCVLRATPAHRALFEHWKELLADPEYHAWQKRPIETRPPHRLSDQDVLAGLVGSSQYSHIPVRQLRRGRDVIHSGGARAYGLGERLRGLFQRRPPVIHNPSVKPWMILWNKPGLEGRQWWLRRLALEISPYVAEVRQYRSRMGAEDCCWMDWKTPTGVALRILGFGNTALRGLPLTIVVTFIGWLRPSSVTPGASNK